jgi:hypothetical protein
MIVMRHVAARVTAALTLLTASLAWAAPAHADVDGFDAKFGQAPSSFTTGKAARTLTAVVSTDRESRRCLKVRWTLIIQSRGVSLNQVKVNRVEDGKAFKVQARLTDDGARITDAKADPGQLCRGRTVTGQWDISFSGPDNGSVTFEARASEGGKVLASASTTSRVVDAVAAKPSTSPTPTTSPSQEAAVADQPTPDQSSAGAAALNPSSGTPSVLGPGLIVGGVLVFIGVALLLRIRSRNRKNPAWQTETQQLPTGFYGDMPPRRRQ